MHTVGMVSFTLQLTVGENLYSVISQTTPDPIEVLLGTAARRVHMLSAVLLNKCSSY